MHLVVGSSRAKSGSPKTGWEAEVRRKATPPHFPFPTSSCPRLPSVTSRLVACLLSAPLLDTGWQAREAVRSPRGTSQAGQAGTAGPRVGAQRGAGCRAVLAGGGARCLVLGSYPRYLLDTIPPPLALRPTCRILCTTPPNSSWISWLLPPPRRKARRSLEELRGGVWSILVKAVCLAEGEGGTLRDSSHQARPRFPHLGTCSPFPKPMAWQN